jgi:hypothetical protein
MSKKLTAAYWSKQRKRLDPKGYKKYVAWDKRQKLKIQQKAQQDRQRLAQEKRQKKADVAIKKIANADGKVSAKDVKALNQKGYNTADIKKAVSRVNKSKASKNKKTLTIGNGGNAILKKNKGKDFTPPPKQKPTPTPTTDPTPDPTPDPTTDPTPDPTPTPTPEGDKPPKKPTPGPTNPVVPDPEPEEIDNDVDLPDNDKKWDYETGRFDLQEAIDELEVNEFSDYLFGKDRIQYNDKGELKSYTPPKHERMTAKGSNSDIDLSKSLDESFFAKRGLTINWDNGRPGATMFNEGTTLEKNKHGKKIVNKPIELDFSAGKNEVIKGKTLKGIKSNQKSTQDMMNTITGKAQRNYGKNIKSIQKKGNSLLTRKKRPKK